MCEEQTEYLSLSLSPRTNVHENSYPRLFVPAPALSFLFHLRVYSYKTQMRNYLFPLVIVMTTLLSLSRDNPWTVLAAPLTPRSSEEANAKSPLEIWAAGLNDGSYNPPLVNYTNWSCQPSKGGANPVILLHGLMASPPYKRFGQCHACIFDSCIAHRNSN